MDKDALALISQQLKALKVEELKNICRVLRQKTSIKYSGLRKEEMIREIINRLDYSKAFTVQQEKQKKCLAKQMNRLVEITSEKRLRGEDISKEREEYLRLKLQLDPL